MPQRPHLVPLFLLSACLFPPSAGARPGADTSEGERIELASGEMVELRRTDFDASRWSGPDEKRPLLVTFSGKAGAEWSRLMLEAGAEIVSAAPPASFLVRADAAAARRLWNTPGISAVTEVEARWKLEPGLALAAKAMDEGETAAAEIATEAALEIVVYAGEGTDRVDALVREHGLEEGRRTSLDRAVVRARVAPAALDELAALPEVQWIEAARTGRTMNDSIRVVMQTERQHFLANSSFYNPVYAIGVNGSTQLVAMADTGLRSTGMPSQVSHEVYDAPGKIAQYYAPSPGGHRCGALGDIASHGTAVASTLAGDKLGSATGSFGFPNDYDGVAYASRLFVQDVFDDRAPDGYFCENLDTIDDILVPAFAAGARVHNNSWGHTCEVCSQGVSRGSYSVRSQELDAYLSSGVAKENVVVFAVGNYGRLSLYGPVIPRTVSDEAHAKNVIAVGASRDESRRHLMYSFSSRGPTNDCVPMVSGGTCPNPGRVKPDLVAPGSSFIRAAEYASASSYCTASHPICPLGYFGTSHAAPAIAGAAALIRDYFAKGKYPASAPPIVGPPSSALVKAMLVNSSVFLSDSSAYEATVVVGGTTSTYPNYDQGYGRPALDSVLEPAGFRKLLAYQGLSTQVSTDAAWAVSPVFSNLWNATCNTLRVTLAWSDPPATLGLNPVLVNDLDLEVMFGGQTWRGNHGLTGNQPDQLNNVEDVFLPLGQMALGAAVAPVIRVRGARVMTATPQPFALVVTYGPCFGYTPCTDLPSVGCYDGPGDVVPGSKPNPRPGCLDQIYTTQEWCPSCMPPPWPACQPPQLPQPKPAGPIGPIDPDAQP